MVRSRYDITRNKNVHAGMVRLYHVFHGTESGMSIYLDSLISSMWEGYTSQLLGLAV